MAYNIAEWLAKFDAISARRNSCNAAELFAATQRLGQRLDVTRPTVPVVTITGTNGKGSCAALLEAIYLAAGYRVATLTSPHVITINERIRLNGKLIDDRRLCQALSQVNKARGDVVISRFIALCLAALKIFTAQPLDIMIIEVGIGGRYDATNIIDTDLAVITSIALDHCDLLGNSREAIALEKAGIMRPQRPLICGDRAPPSNLEPLAKQNQAHFYQAGRDFNLVAQPQGYSWSCRGGRPLTLPRGHLFADNIASAVMAVEQLQSQLSVPLSAIQQGIAQAQLIGRCHIIDTRPSLVVDVAHNAASVKCLSDQLARLP